MDVRELDRDDLDAWDTYVERSPHAGFFHRSDVLALLSSRGRGTLHHLVGYRNQEPVGLLPLFDRSVKGVLRLVFSPPPLPGMRLGPALLYPDSIKQRKREQWNAAFVEACVDWIGSTLDPAYIGIGPTPQYDDVRPFLWNGFDASLSYTYVLDLAPGEDELMRGFSRDARSNVRNTPEDAYSIREGGTRDIERIVRQVMRRFREQGMRYPIEDSELVRELYRALPEGCVRPYVLFVDGEFSGGIIALEDDRTMYRWIGGARPSVDLPVNELLDWHLIREAKSRGLARYDLVGAIERGIADYKSKFDPTPEVIFSLERASRPMKLLLYGYDRMPAVVRNLVRP